MQREVPRLSACGLNCGLCPRYHAGGASRCPGCGGEGFFDKRPACGVLSCARRHGGLEFCCQCGEYPCAKYEKADRVDSFITHRNMRDNLERVRREGLDAYRLELDEKVEILRALLEGFDDGRHKSFFCLAVNLLGIEDLRAVMADLRGAETDDATRRERAGRAEGLLRDAARERGVELVLRKKG